MAGTITTILLVLAVLRYALRADAQTVKATAEAMSQHEEQCNQEITWLARTGRMTKILVPLGILHYTVRAGLPSVKVTEELLRSHEKAHSVEMTQLLLLDRRMQEQHGLTPGRILLLACHEWWFWVGAEILLLVFGIDWLLRHSSSDRDDGREWETSTSAQEQIKEEEEEEEACEDNPDSHDPPEKPSDKT